jgi:hypothetical protein
MLTTFLRQWPFSWAAMLCDDGLDKKASTQILAVGTCSFPVVQV